MTQECTIAEYIIHLLHFINSPRVLPLLQPEQRRDLNSLNGPNINQPLMCKLILKQPLTWKYRCIQIYTLIRKDRQGIEFNVSELAQSRVPCDKLKVQQYFRQFENAHHCLRNLNRLGYIWQYLLSENKIQLGTY